MKAHHALALLSVLVLSACAVEPPSGGQVEEAATACRGTKPPAPVCKTETCDLDSRQWIAEPLPAGTGCQSTGSCDGSGHCVIPNPPSPPRAPLSLAIASRTSTALTLSWLTSPGASGYTVALSNGYQGTYNATTTTVVLDGLSPAWSYCATVTAFNTGGSASSQVCGATLPPPDPPAVQQWSADSKMGTSSSDSGVSLAFYHGTVYAAYLGADLGDKEVWLNDFSNNIWRAGDEDEGYQSDSAPRLVVFEDTMYMFLINIDGKEPNRVWMLRWDLSLGIFDDPKKTPYLSMVSPVAAEDGTGLHELEIVGLVPGTGQLWEGVMELNGDFITQTSMPGQFAIPTEGPSIVSHTPPDGITRYFLAYSSNTPPTVGTVMIGSMPTGQLGGWIFNPLPQAEFGEPDSTYSPAIASFHGSLHLIHAFDLYHGTIEWNWSMDGDTWSTELELPGNSGPASMWKAPAMAPIVSSPGQPDRLMLAHPTSWDEQHATFGDKSLWYAFFE